MAINHSSEFNNQYPLSDNQRSILFIENLDNASLANNISLELQITGNFDTDLLIRSIRFIIERHASFRTTFPIINNKRVQVVHSEIPVTVNIVHLENEPQERKSATIRQHSLENAKHRFDLVKGPIFLFEILTLGNQTYRLLINIHHLISDAFSLKLLLEELFIVYDSYAKAQPLILPILPATHIDYTLYQEKWLTGNDCKDQLQYWRNELADAPKMIQIPTDLTRPKTPAFNGTSLHFTIDRSLKEKLNEFGEKNDSDLCVTLLTAFGVLLYRYSSQDDFVVGVSFSNRQSKEFKTLIGALANNLPIRFIFREDELFSETAGVIKKKIQTASANQEISYERLIEEVKGSEALSPLSLFNILFSFQPSLNEELNTQDFSLQILQEELPGTLFDISLSVHENKNSLECILGYSADLFFTETIERLAGHYLTILKAITETIDLPIQMIPLLPEAELNRILKDWNNTKITYPEDKCIHHLFEEQVIKSPDAIALVYEDEQVSYSELNSRANQLARYLIEQGAGEDTSIALCVERSVDLVVGLLAISKSGSAYIPLDPIYPKARLALVLDDARPVILLTQTSLMNMIPETGSKIIFIDDTSALNEEKTGNLTYGDPQKLAYILYTSGSTGKPKGVQIRQQAVVNLVNSMSNLLGVTSKDILFAVTTIAFDIAEMEMFLPLFNGAKLVIASQETASDMDLLIDKLQESGATLFQATPVTFKMLVIHSWKGKPDLKVVIGGEALSKELVRELLPRCGEVWNGYGPTETAIYSVVKKLNPEDAIGDGYVPIGRPIDNTYVYVLNPKRFPVPIGIPGELYIGGVGVSPGYLNLPEMTNERFIPDPFIDNPEARIYRTGDLVQYFPDGNLVFLNRVDSQVKIRGFRIELGEIESVLAQYHAIKDIVVIAREDTPGDKKLIAYIILKETEEAGLSDLRQFLKAKLPDYMIPAAFVRMDKFPLTPNGKVDRKALPLPVESYGQISGKYIAPKSEKEKELTLLWTETLKVENIGITDNFFELGGNSLVATMLITRINKSFNISLPLRILFEKQTVEEIAKEIDKQKPQSKDPEPTQTIPHLYTGSNVFPVSSGQRRLWFIENLEPGNRAYNMPFDYLIRGGIDVTILEKSINELIKRHESLRTVIPTRDGIPFQKVLESYIFRLEVENLEHLPEKEKPLEAERHSNENEMHVFDLENGPLFICKLLKISNIEWVLLINMHHIITDGWSVNIFVEELGLIYTALKQQKPVILPSLAITYSDYAVWQNDWLNGAECRKQVDFWTKELNDVPELLQLPMDFMRPKNQTYNGEEVSFIIDKKLTEQLILFGQKNNVSLFISLLSIFNSLISWYSSQEEFVIGIPIAGRIHKELESLVGVLINNFPLRITTRENMSFPEMIEITKKKFFYAYDNQELPFDRIVEELRVSRHPNISPLFQVMFNLVNMFDKEISLSESKMEMIDKRRHIAQFDLSLHIYETKKSLNCVFEYNSNLFKRERIERMAGHYLELVKNILKDPGQKIKRIPILTEKEKKLILEEWNSTIVLFPKDKCIHHIFEEQVLKSPGSIAIIDDQKRVTYSELNEKSNRLARYLHKSGASEGSLIGICIERSSDLLVGLLAILKAGCTYIPLDPIYPKNRLSLILEDGNPIILLTEKKLLESLPEIDVSKVFIEETEKYQNEPGANPGYSVSPNNVAYLIYTSGSTGKPKGVQVEHRSLVNFMESMKRKPGITSNDIMLAVTTISFDIAGLELYLPILNGATTIIASHETTMNPDFLIKRIDDCHPTIIQATPVTFRMLISAGWKGLKKLKILCGGEALPKKLVIELVRKCDELWNMYGPTETTIWSTMEKVELSENDYTGYVNLGHPIDNTFLYVLNSEFQPVPVGYPGELFIGGDGLARGYYHLPELTKEKFLPNPFSEKAGARIYRTGDLVQLMENGRLEFLNRIDSQVKIRGFRIELGEIESILAQHASIKDNVVIVREDNPGDKRLIAYIILKDTGEPELTDLRQFLKAKLPDYMIPSTFIKMEKFPLTPNGKVDRKSLPSPLEVSPQTEKINIAPQTELEEKLLRIWSEVLHLKSIGTNENFFDIGGHSMIAVTLMVKIEKELGVRLPLATLFEQSNIHDMAELLENMVTPPKWGSLVPIKPKGNKRPLYLVHGAGLNLLLYNTIVSHLDPDQPVYGLQAKGLDGEDEPLDTLQEIAAYYISEIISVDASGTYALAGFSMGGQIAYEMARQLLEMGKKISFLGVFDTVSYNVSDKHLPIFKRYFYRTDRLFHQIIWTLNTFFKKPGKEKHEFAASKLNSLKQKITKADYKIQPEGVSQGKRSELPKYLHKVHQANYRAMENYILPVYPGKLYLFRAMDQKFYIKDPVTYGWDEYAKGGVIVLDIPGEHSRIFAPPNDKIFSELLQRCLNESEVPNQNKPDAIL